MVGPRTPPHPIPTFPIALPVNLLVRGLRAYSDFEGEFRMALINRRLSGIETAFLMADKDKEHVSSTLVREVRARGLRAPALTPTPHHHLPRTAGPLWQNAAGFRP